MDRGEFVKQPIEISPTSNGGYVVRRQSGQYQLDLISSWLAFSNHGDLLRWLSDEYPVANGAAAPGPDPLYPGKWEVT